MNKYGARKTECRYNHVHDSKREALRCNELHLLERAGHISGLGIQRKFTFEIDGKPIKHRNGHTAGFTVDFLYFEGDRQIAEDSKGYVVRDYPLRAALFRALFPQIELREV